MSLTNTHLCSFADASTAAMSTTLHRLYRLAAPQRAPVIEMDLISVEPPPTSAADVPVYGEGRLNASFSAACPSQINTAGVRQLVTGEQLIML